MQTYLMRNGIEERDYTEEIPEWTRLVLAVQMDARAEEKAAIAAVLAGLPDSASSVKQEDTVAAAAQKEHGSSTKQRVAALIGRSRKAYGILYASLPADLRLLVADVPQGYAYGIWTFLEKKFRNTEQDNVAALWAEFVNLSQTSSENFDEYKARVDSIVELLTHAKQQPPPGLYMTLLLWKLQPRYATAVLTLKTGDRMKDPTKIDWTAIVEYMGQYERSQHGLEGTDVSDRTMAARARSPPKKKVTSGGPASKPLPSRPQIPLCEVKCYNCQEFGHYASSCDQPEKQKKMRDTRKKGKSTPKGNNSGDDKDQVAAAASQRANMTRQSNRFDALTDSDSQNSDVEEGKTNTKSRESGHRTWAMIAAAAAMTSGPATPEKSLDELLRTTTKAVDTAATLATTGNRKTLRNIRRCEPVPIRMANGSVVSAMYKGDMPLRLKVFNSDKYVHVMIRNVYYHKRFDANLLSWGAMKEDGWKLHSETDATYVVTPQGDRVVTNSSGRLITINTVPEPQRLTSQRTYSVGSIVCTSADEVMKLHRRLGHVSWSRLLEMSKNGTTVGIPNIKDMSKTELSKAEKAVKECTTCVTSKAHRKALGHHGLDKGVRIGEVLHMDTFYSVTRDLTTGKKKTEYCLVAVDAYNEWRWQDPTSTLADLSKSAIDIIQHSHTLSGRYPRLIITDLGSEFENNLVRHFGTKHGIQIQPTPARAKELHGLAEKNVDTTKNHVRAMLLGANMPAEFGWRYGIQHFVYMWNRTHVGARTGVTPYQSVTGREPSVLNVGEFGCDVFVHQHRSTRDTTFGPKSEPGIYLGHSARQNCPIVRMLGSGKIILSKDVHFREGSFKHLRATLRNEEEDVRPLIVDAGLPDQDDNPTVPAEHRDGHDEKDADINDASIENAEVEAEPMRYTLKAITESRIEDGVKQYRCKWTGYRATTWEPASVIEEDAPEVARRYETFLESRAQARITRSRSSRQETSDSASSPKPTAPAAAAESDSDSELERAATYAARCL